MEDNKQTYNDTYLAKWMEGSISDKELENYISKTEIEKYIALRESIELRQKLENPLDINLKALEETIAKRKLKVIYKKAAILSMSAAAVAILFLIISPFSSSQMHMASISETKVFALPDKSVVTLNSNSNLSFIEEKWKDNDRQVYLEGEAFFKVEKGEKFTVKTKHGTVSVLGTQFNVVSANDYFEVYCYTGKVKVVSNNDSIILTPNKAVRKISDNTKFEKDLTTLDTPSWINGESSFKSTPLSQVIEALENKYGVTVTINGVDLKQRFTGSFTHDNIDFALKTVFEAMDIPYNKLTPEQIELVQ